MRGTRPQSLTEALRLLKASKEYQEFQESWGPGGLRDKGVIEAILGFRVPTTTVGAGARVVRGQGGMRQGEGSKRQGESNRDKGEQDRGEGSKGSKTGASRS